MNVRLSRHAKRRAKLYKIPEPAILDALQPQKLGSGAHEIEIEVDACKFPVKLVLNVEGDTITVVTSYPLKKGRKP